MIFFDPIKVENVKLCKILYSKWYKLLFHLGVTTVAEHRLYQVGNQAKRHHSGWKPPPSPPPKKKWCSTGSQHWFVIFTLPVLHYINEIKSIHSFTDPVSFRN